MEDRINIANFAKFSWGNILEWYDFTLYGLFAVQLSGVFFPNSSQHDGLLLVLMTFAVGFIARPLGALIFGILGDRVGRKYAVNLSIWLMVIPTMGIGLLPGFKQFGIFAQIMLFGLRLLQGISAGGQFSGLLVIARDESSRNRALLTSIVYSVSVLGGFLASLVAYLVLLISKSIHLEFLELHYWRIPFLLSGLIFIIYLIINSGSQITHFSKPRPYSFVELISTQKLELFSLILFSMLNGSIYYLLYNYLVIFLRVHSNVVQTSAFLLENGILLLSIVLYPWFGYKADRSSNLLKHSLFNLGFMLFSLIIIYKFQTYVSLEIIGLVILVACDCALTAYMISVYTGIFNAQYKMSSFSLAFNIGATLSGFAPLIVEAISKYSLKLPFAYMGLIIILLFFNLLILQRTRGYSVFYLAKP